MSCSCDLLTDVSPIRSNAHLGNLSRSGLRSCLPRCRHAFSHRRPAQPDLTFQGSVSASPSSVAPGGILSVSYTIRNQGNAAAGRSVTRIRIRDAANEIKYEEDHGTDSLGVNGSAFESETIFLPDDLTCGNYTVVVILDVYSSIGQDIESNDIGTAPLAVTGQPDLAFST